MQRILPLAFLACLSTPLRAGGSSVEALLLVDPADAQSLHLANVYRARRDLPAANTLYLSPVAGNYAQFAGGQLPGFLGTLEQRDQQHIDYVIVPSCPEYSIPAGGLISDGCVAVNRFSITAGFTLAYRSDLILSGSLSSSFAHQYSRDNWAARGFESETTYRNGNPSSEPEAERYYIGALLGYTGERGNTLADVLDMIERSAAADFSQPAGTVYYMQTNDVARSSPRHDSYPQAVLEMIAAGGLGQHLFAVLPEGQQDALGVMTGIANADIDGADMTLLPGSFADHLTSFAGAFDVASQTKMSRWIAKGASGTAGAVEEPCNYAGKFPDARLHVVYRKGLSLGEAWLRSLDFEPFQNLFLGDPLTQPYAIPPLVSIPDLPGGPVSGVFSITPDAQPQDGGSIESLTVFLDGRRLASGPPGTAFSIDSTTLADGHHDLRVLAVDSKFVRNKASVRADLTVTNHGHALSLGSNVVAGDLATLFPIDAVATSGNGSPMTELRLWHAGRVVASSDQGTATLPVYGQNLGAGPVELVAEAQFQDGTTVRSLPLAIDVANAGSLPAGGSPVAHGYTRGIDAGAPFVLELPVTHGQAFDQVSFQIEQAPAQASILAQGPGWVVLEPDAAATGNDLLRFSVTSPLGYSGAADVVIDYGPSCNAENYCGTSPNSVGPGVSLASQGTTSVSANDWLITASGGPAGQFGIFFYGPDEVSVPFGDGLRCVGGGLLRFSPVAMDAGGSAQWALDVTTPPEPSGQISAGETWRFQFWYRDPAQGLSGFNLSDGLRATFCP